MQGCFSSHVIGQFLERGYVEALLPLEGRASLRVCLRVPSSEQSLPQRLALAESLLPQLLQQLGRAEQMASASRAGSEPVHTWDVWIEEDNSASFLCAPYEAERDEFSIVRWSAGALEVKQ